MCKKLVKFISIGLILICGFFLINDKSIDAGYKYCDTRIEDTPYYDCGNYIYTYYEDTSHSSMVYSLDEYTSILYVGEVDGVSIFYTSGFRFYNRSYDDRETENNNLWSVLYTKGSVVFSGKFDDLWLTNDSHEGYYKQKLYQEKYTIKQYVNDGKLYRTIVIYNISSNEIDFGSAMYNGNKLTISVEEVLPASEDFSISVDSKYGISMVRTYIGNNEVTNTRKGKIITIDKSLLNQYLIKGEEVTIKIKVYDYLSKEKTVSYNLLLLNNDVSIKFKSIASVAASKSRRIVVEASPGKGKNIDTDYCWYYWSTSPDDSLNYDDFLRNYALSEYKGSYSEDKGVILRNTSGTYYLYALARDEDSSIVSRSEGYTLDQDSVNLNYNLKDAILIVSLLIVATLPIGIYLYLKKKGY